MKKDRQFYKDLAAGLASRGFNMVMIVQGLVAAGCVYDLALDLAIEVQ